ncbi:four helix bundle protein [Fibrella aestuarina]|uniref:four helix bundle protein n=1 Tax=Fibrella aestuarina TaxID=651143 RepID=UPI0008141838|nr:four helix bundle protein [Fibrella aestuarina]
MGINELQVYQLAMTLGEHVWGIVANWDSFAKQTLGNQLVRAADSVAANISEGFGRYHYKENIRFCYIARGSRGSLLETRTWLDKAQRRALLADDLHRQLEQDINTLGVKLNNYLKSLGQKANLTSADHQVSESDVFYRSSHSDSQWDTTNDNE